MFETAHLYALPAGAKGFDTDSVVTDAVLTAAEARGYRYIGRYVTRTAPHDYDLSLPEAQRIIAAGFGLFLIQHVAPDGWVPSGGLGTSYAQTALLAAIALRMPYGTPIVLDLEGVKPGTPAAAVIDYANSWHALVAGHGFLPAIYLGWRSGISGKDAYWKLRFTHYFAAYNLNADQYPAVRGVQLQQAKQVKVGGILVDPLTAAVDRLGGAFPVLRREDGLTLARRGAGAARKRAKRKH